MWLQDTAGEVGVPYHLIKSGRARGDVLVLTKLKVKGKDIPSRFRPESKELPRIGKPVEGDKIVSLCICSTTSGSPPSSPLLKDTDTKANGAGEGRFLS